MLPFDGLYGQDAFAYFRFARAIGPHLFAGAPLPDLFWPRGYPAAVAALLPLTGGSPLAGQIVSALACAWTASATFLLVKELDRLRGADGDPTAAMVAGLVVAASGVVLRSSQVVMADGLAMALSATALWCAARFLRARRGPWLVACTVAIAWGAVTRWQVGLIAIPIGASLAAAPRPAPARTGWIWWVLAALAGLAVLVPQLAAARAVPYSLAHHEWLQRWNPLNALRRNFTTREASSHYRFPVGIFYLLRLGWPDALFPVITALAVAGAWVVGRERRTVAVLLLIGWPLVNWAFISGIPYENPRFLWAAIPAIGALGGIGFATVRARLSQRARPLLALLLAASMAAGLGLGAREHAHTVARKNADRATVDWIDAHVPPGATLLMPGGTLMLEYYGRTRVRDTYLLTRADVDAILARECPCFYFADLFELEIVQAGLPVEAGFKALLQKPGLTPIASLGPSSKLFRVGPAR